MVVQAEGSGLRKDDYQKLFSAMIFISVSC